MIKNLLREVVIFEMIIFSGSLRFTIQRNALSMIIYVATCTLFYFIHRKSYSPIIIRRNLLLLIPIAIWPLFDSFVLFTPPFGSPGGAIPPLMYGLGTLLIVSQFNFYEFREKIFRYFNFLVIISIVVYILHYLGYVISTYENLGPTYNQMCLWAFHIYGDDGERLSSIFWEPGQFQIVIFYIMCLFMDEWQDLRKIKKNIQKHFFLIVALILTFSTAAYMVSIIFFGIIILFSSLTRRYLILVPVAILLVLLIGTAIYTSTVVQTKIEGFGSEGTSAQIRLNDNLACIEVIKDSPFCGMGMETSEFQYHSKRAGNMTQSNGWLTMAAQNGLPYLFFFLLIMYGKIKLQNSDIPAIAILLTLIISQTDEARPYFPYMFMYIFKFGRYNKNVLIKK